MPFGISTGRYLWYIGISLGAMFAGSQVVHEYYQPLSDLDEYVAREEQRRKVASEASSWKFQLRSQNGFYLLICSVGIMLNKEKKKLNFGYFY